jgi:hypothetical protein
MSDTLIHARFPAASSSSPQHLESPTAPLPKRSFAEALASVEVIESTPAAQGGSLLDIINALLGKDEMSKEDLVALRARLRRYSSQVNRLDSLLRALVRTMGTHRKPQQPQEE